MDRYQETVDRLSVIRRFLIPVQSDDPIPGRPRCWGLTPRDFELVVMGHACSSCLACWEPALLDTCPYCGLERDTNQMVVQRPDWEAHERYVEEELANPVRTRVPQMHEIVEQISRDRLEGHMPGRKKNL